MLEHICWEGTLATFDTLKQYGLSNQYFFRYMQLRHASITQFGSQSLTILQPILESLLREDPLDKPMSNIYKTLLPQYSLGWRDYMLCGEKMR